MFLKRHINDAKVKYTRYILHGNPLNFENLGVIAIPSAFMAAPFLLWLLCGATVMDTGRILKLKYLLRQRELKHEQYIKCVLRSLDVRATRENIKMLRAA